MTPQEIESRINSLYAKISENKRFLQENVYVVIRAIKNNEQIPTDIKQKRSDARAEIKSAQEQITELEELLAEAIEAEQTNTQE